MKYTKEYWNKNQSGYSIYFGFGNTKEEFSFINSYDYDGKYITWCIDMMERMNTQA